MKILVTGGAGFIGSHLVDALLAHGHEVRVFDSLEPQVHGGLREDGKRPDYLDPGVELIVGDVRNREALRRALEGVEAVFHQAAVVGVGQSMYEIERYTDTNVRGTAVLLDILSNEHNGVGKLIVASSMSIYGEGAYRCAGCGPVYPALRSEEQLAARDWEMRCPWCGEHVEAQPTAEGKPLAPTSVYAINKRDQEEMCLTVGRAYSIPTVALRYFNVYGPRQALSNPYTGVAAIFSSRLLNDTPPLIFEDGRQGRDFVHVSDIVQANLLALESEAANYGVFNVGTGKATTVREVAEILNRVLDRDLEPAMVEKFRAGDIRHCYADIGKAQRALGYAPRISFEEGMRGLVAWVRAQEAEDRAEQATRELERRGLIL